MSLIGDLEKGHTFVLFSNLVGLYVSLRQLSDEQKYFFIKIFVLSGVLSCVLAIKELYYPSFEYGALGERALGSFGHPNYLSGYLLLLLPFIFCSPFPFAKERIQVWIRSFILLLFLTTIILSKSLVALFLAIVYLVYMFINNPPTPLRFLFPLTKGDRISYGIWGIILGIIICIALAFITLFFPEKLHSLISRWYLWETTVSIIFSDIKIIFIGAGLETLPYYFNSFKVPEIYIFENFGYSADRPHNFFLNIFYHFGLLGVSIFVYLIYIFFSLFQRESPQGEGLEFQEDYKIAISAVVLFLLYSIFHYFSIVSYLLLLLAIALLFYKNHSKLHSVKLFFSLIVFISILGAFSSIRLYAGEIYYQKSQQQTSLDMIFHPKYFLSFGLTDKAAKLEGIVSQRNYKTQITLSEKKKESCDSFTQSYPSAENYFYCGNILQTQGDLNTSQIYYNLGLSRLPDLWNQDSPYWDQYFVKHTITGNRFFSPKFGDIHSVLRKIED